MATYPFIAKPLIRYKPFFTKNKEVSPNFVHVMIDIGSERINALATMTFLEGKTKILAANSVGQLTFLSQEPNDVIKSTVFAKAHSASVTHIQTSSELSLIVSAANGTLNATDIVDYTVKLWKVDQHDPKRRSFSSMSNLSKIQAANGCQVRCLYTLDLKQHNPVKIHAVFLEDVIQIYAVTPAQLMVSYAYSYEAGILYFNA
jgi:hypothetical protein